MSRVSAALAAAALTAIGIVGSGAGATSALADTAPYTDQSANGLLTLCSAAGAPVTSGSINDKPFVALAVGSEPAPAAYQGTGQKATLYAYVPRKDVDPTQWSGEILTASSTYSDPKFPTTVGTKVDTGLAGIINELPPQWNGYYQLRMLYSAPNRGVDDSTYGTADIQVTGDTWHLLNGGTAPCSAGKAVSSEARVPGLLTPTPTFIPTYINGRPNPAAFPHGLPTGPLATFHDPDDATPTPTASSSAASAGAAAATASGPGSTSSAPSSGAVAGADGTSTPSTQLATAGQSSRSSSNLTAVVLGVLLGLVVAGLAVFGFVRVRSTRRP